MSQFLTYGARRAALASLWIAPGRARQALVFTLHEQPSRWLGLDLSPLPLTDYPMLEVQALADEQSFFRLFLAPGMGHCSGGPGPNAFGQLGGTPVATDAQHDLLQALVHWVTTGEPPAQVVATKFVNDTPANGVLMTRPLCPFPKLPQYRGSGDPTDAASFVCVDDGVHHNPTPAPEYLKD
jgi:hypothetical protein